MNREALLQTSQAKPPEQGRAVSCDDANPCPNDIGLRRHARGRLVAIQLVTEVTGVGGEAYLVDDLASARGGCSSPFVAKANAKTRALLLAARIAGSARSDRTAYLLQNQPNRLRPRWSRHGGRTSERATVLAAECGDHECEFSR